MRGVTYYNRTTPSRRRPAIGVLAGVLLLGQWATAHVFIVEPLRVGAYPPWSGSGWIGEAYLALPDEHAVTLITAESYVANNGIEPDFTFRTPYIDFPAGLDPFDLDTRFETVGDFLDDYIYDVSDPSRLDEPFGHMLLRFRGFVRVSSADSVGPDPRLPVWLEMATTAHDGFRTRISETIYRLPTTQPGAASFRENAIIMAMGLFPIEVTYLNRFDADGTENWRFAGIEFYSWHEPGTERPGSVSLEDPVLGYPSLFPPHAIYGEDDIQPLLDGDFEADSDIDLADHAALQDCFTGPPDEELIILDLGCAAFDFDADGDIDRDDHAEFVAAQTGPGG